MKSSNFCSRIALIFEIFVYVRHFKTFYNREWRFLSQTKLILSDTDKVVLLVSFKNEWNSCIGTLNSRSRKCKVMWMFVFIFKTIYNLNFSEKFFIEETLKAIFRRTHYFVKISILLKIVHKETKRKIGALQLHKV